MLYLHFGKLDGELWAPGDVFNLTYEDEWFNDSIVKQMVHDIDKSIVQSANSIISPVLGNISCKHLSGGVRNLIMAYKTDYIIDFSFCGNNCAEWILKLASMKDIRGTLHHCMLFPEPFEMIITNTNKIVRNNDEYIQEFMGAVERGEY